MAIELMLEIDTRFSIEDIRSALASFPGSDIVEETVGLTGPVSADGPYIFVHREAVPKASLSNGYSADWLVAGRIVFRVFTSHYAANLSAVKRFVQLLADLSPAFFVLSFQYDALYAVRDESGLHFFGPLLPGP